MEGRSEFAPRRPRDSSGVKNFPKFKSPSALPRHMEQEVKTPARYKSNSTSSLYIKDTLGAPDVDELIHCMSVALHYHIMAGHDSEHKTFFEIFDEEKHPLTRGPVTVYNPPDVNVIYKFLNTIFKAERLGAECGILCLAYIERIIALTGLSLHASNWRRVTLSALILASKVWEDQAVWNVDFLSVFPCVTVQDLAQLEKVILNLLQFNVSLKASLYAKYYFELRSLAENDSIQFPLEPLSKEAAERLETRSEETEQTVRSQSDSKYKLSRSNSETSIKSKSPRMVLS
jgi:hypothetical protein